MREVLIFFVIVASLLFWGCAGVSETASRQEKKELKKTEKVFNNKKEPLFKLKWKRYVGKYNWPFTNQPLIFGEYILHATNGDRTNEKDSKDKLYVFDKNGKLLWSFEGTHDMNGVVANPDFIVVSDEAGYVYVLSWEGKLLWKFKTGAGINSSPALGDLNKDGYLDVVVGSDDNYIYALSGKDGTLLWKFETGGDVDSSPALGDVDRDGYIDMVVVSFDGYLYLFESTVKGGKVVWSRWHGDASGTGLYENAVSFAKFNLSGKAFVWYPLGSTNYFYAETVVKLILSNGKIITLPKGTFVERTEKGFKVGRRVYEGILAEGKLKPLYSYKPVVILEDTPLKRHPESRDYFSVIPAGSVIKRIYCSEGRETCYVILRGKRGFITEHKYTKLVSRNLIFSIVSSSGLRASPHGEFKYPVPKDALVESLYYAPEVKSYYVRYGRVKGWVSEKELKRIDFEDINLTLVALKDTPVYISPYVKTVVGYIAEGEEIKVKKREKNTGMLFIEDEKFFGFAPSPNFAKVTPVSPQRMWTVQKTELYLSPDGTQIGVIPEYTEVKVLKEAKGYMFITSGKYRGWVKNDYLTAIKPDLYEPYIKVVKSGKRIKVYVADDTEIHGVYVNGEPVLEFKRLKRLKNLPFKAEDIRVFTYPLVKEAVIEVEDRDGRLSKVYVYLKGNKLIVEGSPVKVQTITAVAEERGIPNLSLSVNISDEDGDRLFEGREKITINVKAVNSGTAVAKNVMLKIKGAKALGIPDEFNLGSIPPAGIVSKTYTFRLKDKIGGEHRLVFSLETSDGFESNPLAITLVARDYIPPRFIFDYAIKDGNGNGKIEPAEVATLFVYVQNVGGDARNLTVNISLPRDIKIIEGKTVHKIAHLPEGEVKKFSITVVVPHRYARSHRDIPVKVSISGKDVKVAKSISFALGEYIKPVEEIALKPEKRRIETVFSELLVKVREFKKPERFREDAIALVIGIEDYRNLPPSQYSTNDALLMKEILERVYGIKTITLINQDATLAQIKSAINRLSGLANRKKVYIYYSGHGFVKGNIPSIVPYDIPKTIDEELTISYQEIIDTIKEVANPERIVIISDSCYSGVGRDNTRLVATARPVFLAPKELIRPERTAYISATQGSGKSYSDKKLKHGILTYYVAKALMEGDMDKDNVIEIHELKVYIEEAKRHARALGYTDQIPNLKARGLEMIIER